MHHIIFVKMCHLPIDLIMEDEPQDTTLYFGTKLKSTNKNRFFMIILPLFYHLHKNFFLFLLFTIWFWKICLLLEADNIPQRQYSRDDLQSEIITCQRPIVGSDPFAETQIKKQELTKNLKALVNPFNPSQITIKLTSNRRRWTHVFPLGKFRILFISNM